MHLKKKNYIFDLALSAHVGGAAFGLSKNVK